MTDLPWSAIVQAAPNVAGTLGLLVAFGAVFRVWLNGFSGLSTAQQAQIASLQAQVDHANAHNADCERRLASVEGQLEGFRRQILDQSIRQAVPLRELSPMAAAAAERSREILEKTEGQQ